MKLNILRSITIGNDTSLITPLVEQLLDEGESIGAVTEDDRCKVMMSLVEALNNAIIHGNLEVSSELREIDTFAYQSVIKVRRRMSPYCTRKVQIKYRFTCQSAMFQISDQGPGFDLLQLSDPTEAENLHRVSGRGIAIMRAFLDEVQYNAVGNRVTLLKYANGSDESDDECLETCVAVPNAAVESHEFAWVRKAGH